MGKSHHRDGSEERFRLKTFSHRLFPKRTPSKRSLPDSKGCSLKEKKHLFYHQASLSGSWKSSHIKQRVFIILARIYSRVYRHSPLMRGTQWWRFADMSPLPPPPPVRLAVKGHLMRIQWECGACCELAGRRLHAVRWWKRKRHGNLRCSQKEILLW